MSRAVEHASVVLLVLIAIPLLVGIAPGTAAGSAQPGPFCGVCGEAFHEDVIESHATLRMTDDGDVRWRVENRVTQQRAAAWGENPGAAERRARERLDGGYVDPVDPTDLSVDVDGDTVVVTFLDRGAARQRLGTFVLPYFHGEGAERRWVVNVEELVVEAPDGHRIVNAPAGAAVEGDRAVWTGSSSREDYDTAPEPGDTYVVAGSGPTADARGDVATTLEPLDPRLYGAYLVGLGFVALVTFGVYTVEGTRLGARRVAAGVGLPAAAYIGIVARVHPLRLAGLPGFFFALLFGAMTLLLAILGGTLLYGWAAVAGDDRPTEGPA